MDIKPPITFKEQLSKIEQRGCIIGDDVFAESVLHRINYYRLTAYFFHLTIQMELIKKERHLILYIEF